MPLDPNTQQETGWLSKWAFQKGALAADVVGRQAIADGYFDISMASKFAGVLPRLTTFVIAANNSSASHKAEADYKCTGTADNITIALAVAAGVALGLPFSIYFAPGTYNIAASITVPSNLRLIFDNASFVATGTATRMFLADGAWVNISSEGKVSFNGMKLMDKCLDFPGFGTPATIDKYLDWNAATTLTGFKVSGLTFSYGKHYRIRDFTAIDQGYGVSFTGFSDVSIEKWRLLYTDLSTCSYNTGTAIFTNGSTTVQGVLTGWTSALDGTFISIVPQVDSSWYQIDHVTDPTHLELKTPYLLAGGPATAYLIITSNDPSRGGGDFYPTSEEPFGRGLHIGDVYIDAGNKQEHCWGASPGTDLLRSLEDVQIDRLTFVNGPRRVDQTPIIWAWVNGFKLTNFYVDCGQIIIQGSDIDVAHGYLRRCPSGGLSIHLLTGGTRRVTLDDITSCNNGHFAATTRPVHGIRIGGWNAANPTTKVSLSNIRCYDDQDLMTNALASNAASGQPNITMASLFSNKQWFYVGQLITISDSTPQSENVEILSIDWTTKVITLAANLANTYTMAKTPIITGRKTQLKGIWLSGYLRDVKFGSGIDCRGTVDAGVYEGECGDGNGIDAGNIEGNMKVQSAELDLSGGSTDVATFTATVPCQLIGYDLFYTEASSGNAGVNIRIGRYNVGAALDDDYFDVSVSEISKALGYQKSFQYSDLTTTKIAAGDTVTVGTAGGKVGIGNVKIALRIVEMSD